MTISIGSVAPDFEQDSTHGRIKFHEYIGDSWCILFSHPKDFTPVCTTELGAVAGMKPEFDKRNTKLIGLSVDGVADHEGWSRDIEDVTGNALNYPLLADTDLSVSKAYNMLPAGAGETSEGRTPVDNATVRNVYVIGPDKQIKAMISYPMSTGRNFDEILRLLDSCQLTANHKVATPANWNSGENVIIVPAVKDDEARERFKEWDAPKPYIRIVPQPGN